MRYVATTSAMTGEMIRDLMAETVEYRFSSTSVPHPLEWLTDNGPPYTARETRTFGASVGLLVRTTPAYSPQSNGMAEAFVKTFKRDYVYVNDVSTAASVFAQLPRWFADYNENAPHKGTSNDDAKPVSTRFKQRLDDFGIAGATPWLYLAVVIDLFSRRVVGFAVDDNMRTELPLRALKMAIQRRRPPTGLIHHSDRGSQYTSREFQKALAGFGAVASMSGAGNCYDNAVAESFFSTIKHELIFKYPWPTRRGASAAIVDYITNFYNPERMHSANNYLSPIEKELHFNNAALAA